MNQQREHCEYCMRTLGDDWEPACIYCIGRGAPPDRDAASRLACAPIVPRSEHAQRSLKRVEGEGVLDNHESNTRAACVEGIHVRNAPADDDDPERDARALRETDSARPTALRRGEPQSAAAAAAELGDWCAALDASAADLRERSYQLTEWGHVELAAAVLGAALDVSAAVLRLRLLIDRAPR